MYFVLRSGTGCASQDHLCQSDKTTKVSLIATITYLFEKAQVSYFTKAVSVDEAEFVELMCELLIREFLWFLNIIRKLSQNREFTFFILLREVLHLIQLLFLIFSVPFVQREVNQ